MDYGYKTEDVKATGVASEEIDKTFRSSTIGEPLITSPQMSPWPN